jgi:hypothetical protein
MVEIDDLLHKAGVDPSNVMVMCHRPTEKGLRQSLPTLAAECHGIYNPYQCQHAETVEMALSRPTHLASFIGHETGRALFVGLYAVAGFRRSSLWFDLRMEPELSDLNGRLVVDGPGIERSWWRWASRNRFAVHCIHEESRLTRPMPAWNDLVLDGTRLKLLPDSWRQALSYWRGVYYIFDTSLKQGYVGFASGSDNLLGRCKDYAASGHGGNRLLRQRNPEHFELSLLEPVSPDMDGSEVIATERLWKRRLHTRAPLGLNDN